MGLLQLCGSPGIVLSTIIIDELVTNLKVILRFVILSEAKNLAWATKLILLRFLSPVEIIAHRQPADYSIFSFPDC